MNLILAVCLFSISVATAGRLPFIVGGRDATKGKWLCQAALETSIYKSHSCGAVVVGPRHLITAAHCIAKREPSSRRIVLGQYDRETRKEYKPEFYSIAKFIVHPKFEQVGSKGFPNDVGIIILYKNIDFSNQFVKKCPLALANGGDFAGNQCTITGWGRLYGFGPMPNNLQEADVDILTKKNCTDMWGETRINDGHICVFDSLTKKRGACNGDSGGPLFCDGADGVTYIAGLTSWGRSGCVTSSPSVYSRVSHFRKWFDENLL